MLLTNTQDLPVGQAQAWEALNDIDLLRSAIPGCESITPTGENQYELLVTASVGPVKAKFKGKLRLDKINPPTSYTIFFEGQSGAAGHGKGNAEVRLEAVSPKQTTLHYTAQASVGGKLAQIGSRLVDMAAQKMAADFFAAFNLRLQERYAVVAAPMVAAPAPSSAWARLMAWWRRLLG